MSFRFAALNHQYHCSCVAISAEGLTRLIVLLPARGGVCTRWRVMQRPAAGRAPAGRPARGPLDGLGMHEIAARALREHGLDPQHASWDDICALAARSDYAAPPQRAASAA